MYIRTSILVHTDYVDPFDGYIHSAVTLFKSFFDVLVHTYM